MIQSNDPVVWCIEAPNATLCTPHVPELYEGGPWQPFQAWPQGALSVKNAPSEHSAFWDDVLAPFGNFFLESPLGPPMAGLLVGCIICLVSWWAARLIPIELDESTSAEQM